MTNLNDIETLLTSSEGKSKQNINIRFSKNITKICAKHGMVLNLLLATT